MLAGLHETLTDVIVGDGGGGELLLLLPPHPAKNAIRPKVSSTTSFRACDKRELSHEVSSIR